MLRILATLFNCLFNFRIRPLALLVLDILVLLLRLGSNNASDTYSKSILVRRFLNPMENNIDQSADI